LDTTHPETAVRQVFENAGEELMGPQNTSTELVAERGLKLAKEKHEAEVAKIARLKALRLAREAEIAQLPEDKKTNDKKRKRKKDNS
jgi:hypothetical protein